MHVGIGTIPPNTADRRRPSSLLEVRRQEVSIRTRRGDQSKHNVSRRALEGTYHLVLLLFAEDKVDLSSTGPKGVAIMQ